MCTQGIPLRRTLEEILDYLNNYDKQNTTKTRDEFIEFFKTYRPQKVNYVLGEDPYGPTQTYTEKTLDQNPLLNQAKLDKSDFKYPDDFSKYDVRHFGIKPTFGGWPINVKNAMSNIPLTAEEIHTIMSGIDWCYKSYGITAFSYDGYYEILNMVLESLTKNNKFDYAKTMIDEFMRTISKTGTDVNANLKIVNKFNDDLKEILVDSKDLRDIFSRAIWNCRESGTYSDDVLKKRLC